MLAANYWHNSCSSKNFLQEHLRLQVRVVGIANSRKMLVDEEGIDLNKWNESVIRRR